MRLPSDATQSAPCPRHRPEGDLLLETARGGGATCALLAVCGISMLFGKNRKDCHFFKLRTIEIKRGRNDRECFQ